MQAVPLEGTERKREVLRVKLSVSESRAAYLRSTGRKRDAVEAGQHEASAEMLRARLTQINAV